MTKFLSGIPILLCLLLLMPQRSLSQIIPCPISGVYNNNQYIALVVPNPIQGWVDGNYSLLLVSSNMSDCFVLGETVPFFKTDNVKTYIPEAPDAAQVIIIDVRNTSCAASMTPNMLQSGNASIYATRPSDGLQFLTLNMTENHIDECEMLAVPSTFISFSATPTPPSVKLQWTAVNESNMGHYSIEKNTYAPGTTWTKIGQVTAANAGSASYTWYDNNPLKEAYYRIVSVDNNCHKVYSKTIQYKCASCATGTVSPVGPADCISPYTGPAVVGPDGICNTDRKLYKLKNLSGIATTTWSITPNNVATLTNAGRMVIVQPTGVPGYATLTATSVKNGVTSHYSKDIFFGVPNLVVGQVSYPMFDMGEGVVYWEVTPNFFPNTHSSQYSWYQNGVFIGNPAYYFAWYLMPQQTINLEIRFNGPCGQMVYSDAYTNPYTYGNGGGGGGNPGGPGGPGGETTWSVTPNPATAGMVSVLIKQPAGTDRIRNTDRFLKPNTGPVTFKLYDKYGNLRKTINTTPMGNRVNINAPELTSGLYYLHILQPGRKTVVLKTWINQ